MVEFLRDENGAITIESVLWLPIYALFLVMIVDVSLLFNGQAQAQRTLQDINRLASSGYYVSEADVEARARSLLGHLSDQLTVDATIDTNLGVITATASMPASDLMAIGTLPKFADIRITVGAWHMIES
jgi:Flp pilus assembly protein TadG